MDKNDIYLGGASKQNALFSENALKTHPCLHSRRNCDSILEVKVREALQIKKSGKLEIVLKETG